MTKNKPKIISYYILKSNKDQYKQWVKIQFTQILKFAHKIYI